MRKLSLSLIIFVFLALPIFVLAQADQAGQATTDAATQGGQSVVTEQQGAGQSGTEQGGASQSGAAQGSAEKPRQNSADKINVKLQIPLPFVPLNCEGGTVCKLTDYLAGVYRMLIGVGALFAVVMIIIAGYQWIFSGGSADRIGAAKKRIIGACMGLILALLSYVILNSISARLVELRLPLVDPVPSIAWGGSGEFCEESEALKQYAQTVKKSLDEILMQPADTGGWSSDQSLPKAPKNTLCGVKYSIAGVDSAGVCKGKSCDVIPGTSCLDDKCQSIFLYGNIINDVKLSLQDAVGGGRRVSGLEVYQICGVFANKIDSIDFSARSGSAKYAFSPRLVDTGAAYTPNLDIKCNVGEKGYVLIVSVNRWLGKDDRYYIGKDCKYLMSKSGADWIDHTSVTGGQKEFFWQKTDFTGQAQECDLDLTNKDQFPPM